MFDYKEICLYIITISTGTFLIIQNLFKTIGF